MKAGRRQLTTGENESPDTALGVYRIDYKMAPEGLPRATSFSGVKKPGEREGGTPCAYDWFSSWALAGVPLL
jgi:hypothetical protein